MASSLRKREDSQIRSYLSDMLSPADLNRFMDDVLPLFKPVSKGGKLSPARAREIIESIVVGQNKALIDPLDKLQFLLACELSNKALPGYSTLDDKHIKSIADLVSTITTYANDTSQRRPLVFLMLASPGAGKSHFIKCIANQLRSSNVSAITYNMAGQQSSDDMIPPLDATRNLKVEDQIPLLFLDEFDSSPSFIPMLLPLLWDGEVTIGQRELKLGKVIIVLAGSDPTLPETMEDARSMRDAGHRPRGKSPKIIDLLSRINGGVFSIPSFFDTGKQIDRRADKVCIVIDLLKQRFGSQLRELPLSLLRFVSRADFRYGVRSIAHLVSLIPFKQGVTLLRARNLALPFDNVVKLKNSSLAYHLLHQDQSLGVEKLWKECLHNDSLIPVKLEDLRNIQRIDLAEDRYSIHIIRRALARLQGKSSHGNDSILLWHRETRRKKSLRSSSRSKVSRRNARESTAARTRKK
jgi:hypothetical protein